MNIRDLQPPTKPQSHTMNVGRALNPMTPEEMEALIDEAKQGYNGRV